MQKEGEIVAKGKYQEWLTDEGLIKIEGWARDGLTDEQISGNMGIAPKTLYRWKENYSQICQALKKGKEVVDRQVENALLKRALGYEYTEDTYELITDTGQKKRHDDVQDLTEEQWEISLAYFDHRCAYCGKAAELTKDHLDPLKNGGKLTFANVVPACKSCNSSKKDHQWMAWYQKQKHYDKQKARRIMEYASFAMLLPQTEGEEGKLVVTKRVTKQMAPDTTAQIFWLKNRKPGVWREKKETELSGAVNVSNPYANLTEDELRKLANL